ncbi:DEAD/DEAH box helicase [Rubritalea marina]|uniref:DEAD/DEAH box helicase n=1 Tax=Rubritalea marina TaxID=361055 RepID=UPI0003753790|nr:DEAD/DEAH box helicase [Rubritalea marina]
MIDFSEFPLSPQIQRVLREESYREPSPIQVKAIPIVLEGHDVLAAAQTGTGKTAGFSLPVLQKLSEGERAKSKRVRALVITPTRELAAQVADNVKKYAKYLDLNTGVAFGGVNIKPQIAKLRAGVDVLVATPGRLLDLCDQGAVSFQDLEVLVLDEADRMLDMGFIHEIKKLLKLLPAKRQTLLFSATFSPEIRKLSKQVVSKPVEISVAPRNTTAQRVTQVVHPVDKVKRGALLLHLIKQHGWKQCLVFVRTKHGANRLARKLESCGVKSSAIHGDKSQGARTKALDGFKAGKLNVLVATDIAARGIDIRQLPQVVNFDLPDQAEDYVHRIGRTGRAGADGHAISLLCVDQFDQLRAIEKLTKLQLKQVVVQGFEPTEVASPQPPKTSNRRPHAKSRSRRPQNKGRGPSRSREQGDRAKSGAKRKPQRNRGNNDTKS